MFDPKNTGTRQAKTMTMQIIETKIAAELCFLLEFFAFGFTSSDTCGCDDLSSFT